MRRKTDYIAFALFIVTIHEIPKRFRIQLLLWVRSDLSFSVTKKYVQRPLL
uniref:Uncharacterized protein n=1 Tax=Anguilla anguilla TaxID=7936 RepID=A0A0E9XIE5_ANGAN